MNWLQTFTQNSFYELTIILLLAAILGAVGQKLRQPLIVMFIALGIIAGPVGLDIVHSEEIIHLLAEIGIVILLFIVGLKLDLRIIKAVGKIALFTGLGQVLFTSLFGFIISTALGFSLLHSFYIAIALTFSSTIVIVKLLSDKKEIDTLHGQISVGFLIVQDIVVILLMIILGTIGQSEQISILQKIIQTSLVGALIGAIAFIASKWVFPKISTFLAKSQELLILACIAWAISLAALGDALQFSSEVGAFIAGVSLASSKFRDVINGRLTNLRDFLLLFFFVSLGANLDLSVISSQLTPAILLSLFVLIGNPLIVLTIMGLMGYSKRTGFLSGLTVAQISEFSLIFAGLGLSIGHINQEILGLITLVGLITIGLSTYLILYSHQIFKLLSPILGIFQRKKLTEKEQQTYKKKTYHIIIIGLGRFGKQLAETIQENHKLNCLGIDFNPVIVNRYRKQGIDAIYGDIDDPEFIDQLPFKDSKIVINTISNYEYAQKLINHLKSIDYHGKTYLTAVKETDLKMLNKAEATEVLQPYQMAATNFYNTNLKKIIKKFNA